MYVLNAILFGRDFLIDLSGNIDPCVARAFRSDASGILRRVHCNILFQRSCDRLDPYPPCVCGLPLPIHSQTPDDPNMRYSFLHQVCPCDSAHYFPGKMAEDYSSYGWRSLCCVANRLGIDSPHSDRMVLADH